MKNRKSSSNKSEFSLLQEPGPVHQGKSRHSFTSWYVEPAHSPSSPCVSPSSLSPLSSPKIKQPLISAAESSEDVAIILSDVDELRKKRKKSAAAGTSEEGNMLGRSRQRSRSMERLLDTHSPTPSTGNVFRREIGDDTIDNEFPSSQSYALLENPENATRWYFKYFLGRVHYNFLCYNSEKTPFFLSVVAGESVYRCILWRKKGNKRLCIQHSGKIPPPKAILEKFAIPKCDKMTIKDISSATLQKDFLTLEEQEGAINFKFGIIYAKTGQTTDDEMFSNRSGSPAFMQFIDLLGDTVDLFGWAHYKGGLDTRNNATGLQSVYTVFGGHEVMFHVSTMLPYSEENKQQLERKRHIGNDIVAIIFIEDDEDDEGVNDKAYMSSLTFTPSSITSHFNHIFALVTYNKSRDSYRLVLYSAESIPSFGPPLPPGGEFEDHFAFRDFLLAKLINGEKASYCISTFADKRERTLGLLMKDMEQKCSHAIRKSLSQLNIMSPNNSKKYFELEQSYIEVGNKIKIEKIVSGNHPTSQITTALKKEPWEATLLLRNFPHKITCGDTCEDGCLIVATPSDGTYMVFTDGTTLQIIDKSLPISHLVIAHRHRLLLIKTGYPKDNYFYAISLEIFFSASVKIRSKSSLSSYQLSYTKGCHLFCTTPLDSQFLRVMVAVKNKVFMLAWKYPAVSCFPATPTTPNHPLEGFVKHRELVLNEVPIMMTFLDDHPSGRLCVMYQKQIEAIDEMSTESQRLYSFDPSKVKITELRAVQNNSRNELLIGYNMSCSILALQDGMVFNSPEMVWNAEPNYIVHTAPYTLAFTADTIEIRKSTNGSLMHTTDVPQLKAISLKDDLVFTSPSLLNQSLQRNDSLTRLGGKAAKILGKANPSSDSINVYRISLENLLGGGGGKGYRGRRSSEKDDETSSSGSRCSILDDVPTTISEEPERCGHEGLRMKDLDDGGILNVTREEGGIILSNVGNHQKSPSTKPRNMYVYPENYDGSRHVGPLSEVFEDSFRLVCTEEDDDEEDGGTRLSIIHNHEMKMTQLQGLHSSYSSSPSILEATHPFSS